MAVQNEQNSVAIAVPIYKAVLSSDERISLTQLRRVLGHYPIYAVGPEYLRPFYCKEGLNPQCFDDCFFQNLESYSELMFSKAFYLRFTEYSYVLIYQMDAFVFSDRLLSFCAMGYDYIGAPVPKTLSEWRKLHICVGNGGLSLRKVSSCLRVTERKNEIANEMMQVNPLIKNFLIWEDVFFSFLANMPHINFAVAPLSVAKRFAIEHDIGHCHRTLKKHLPFGCHGWSRRNFALWKPIIETYGYNLKDMKVSDSTDSYQYRYTMVYDYLLKRLIRDGNQARFIARCKKIVDFLEADIWGYGTQGKRCVTILRILGIEVKYIFDRKFSNALPKANSFRFPDDRSLQNRARILLVASNCNEKKMAEHLNILGLREAVGWESFTKLEKRIWREYYGLR